LFGELPKIFGKEFLIGYLLPAALFGTACAALLQLTGYVSVLFYLKKAFVDVDEKRLAIHLGLALLSIWAVAAILLVTNYKIIRTLEGYGALNAARLLKPWSLHMFDKINRRIDLINAQRPLPPNLVSERRRLRMRLANEFPEDRHLVLPTRFGNIIRAFERYPQIIYNIDAIRSWTRLQAILPDSYKSSLDAAKAVLDFYVNLWFGGMLIAILALLEIARSIIERCPEVSTFTLTEIATTATIVATIFAKLAQGAAMQWGELIKAAFDLYRGELCKQLGFELPRSIARERQMWAPICRTMIYRQARYADDFTSFRPLPNRETD
jgi:hypothetical protein